MMNHDIQENPRSINTLAEALRRIAELEQLLNEQKEIVGALRKNEERCRDFLGNIADGYSE